MEEELTRFQRLILKNRRVGNDYQVLCDYLRIRDEKYVVGKNLSENEFERVLNDVEERINERLK